MNSTMKRIIISAIYLLSIVSTIAGQNYNVFIDDTDKKESLNYFRIAAKDHSSWGYKDKKGKIIIPLGKYKFLNPIDEQGMILAKKGDKEGFIDINENILVPFIYDDAGVFSECVNLAPVIKDKKQGFVNRKGDVIIPLEYDAGSYVTYFYNPGYAILRKNGKSGVIDSYNNIIIPFEYDKIDWSVGKDFFLAAKGKEHVNFSFEGKQLSNFNSYEIVENYDLGYLPADSRGLPILVKTGADKELYNKIRNNIEYMNGTKKIKNSMIVAAGEKYAYLDKEHNKIVPFGVYDFAEPFGLGRKAIVANKGQYGIIDEYGKVVLPLEYDFVERPSNYSSYANIFVATKGEQVFILNGDAGIIPIKDIVSYIDWNGSLFVSDRNSKKGVVDYKGKQTIPFAYDTLYQHRASGYIAKKGDMYGYITKKNAIIKPFKYRYIYELKNDVVYVNKEGKVGIYNEKGKVKIPFDYDAVYDTWYDNFDSEETRYIVVKDGKVGTIDTNNKVVIPLIYDALSGWVEYGPEAHFARKDGKYGLISHEGDIIIPIEYDYVGLPSGGVIKVRKNGKYGVVSWGHKEILPCIYERLIVDIPFFIFDDKQKSKLVTLDNGVWNYFDVDGKILRNNVPEQEIIKDYNYSPQWGEPSNEGYDFHMQQYSIVDLLDKNHIN